MVSARTSVTEAQPSGPTSRREEHLKGARTLLENWRYEVWMELYSEGPYGPEGLLPDAIITKIANSRRLKSVDDLIGIGWSSSRVMKHGMAVVKMLEEYDKDHERTKAAEQEARAAAKKSETAQRQA
ncbi:hypothetical protein BV22DRAFT_1013804, partial [Leucogyrophana mollusca]